MRIGLLLCSLLLSGCLETEVKDVLVIGDSVVVQSSRAIIRAGSAVKVDSGVPRIQFSVLATDGISATTKANDGTEYWGKLIPNIVSNGEFDAIVVELGWNDCGVYPENFKRYGDYIAVASNIINAIRLNDADVPIYWQTTQHPPPCGDVVNNDIAALVPTLPYKEWAQNHPECFADQVHLKSDWNTFLYPSGIAPTQNPPEGYCSGETEYAKWLKAQLDNHFITL